MPRHEIDFALAKSMRAAMRGICMKGVAILSSFPNYTTFTYEGTKLTFRTCNNLDKYTKVILWDKGYLEVMAKYTHEDEEIEEYIDLEPVLNGLYMDKERFLEPIKEVRIEYV